MSIRNNHDAASGRRTISVVLCLGIALAFLIGCSPTATYKKASRSVERSTRKISNISITGDKYRKKVGVAYVVNDTPVVIPEVEQTVMRDMVEVLKDECSKLILLKADDPDCPSPIARPRALPSGRLDNLALARIGRELGLNAIITAGLIDIGTHQEDSGFLWFRDTELYLQARLRAVVYDTETAAKILDESFMDEVEIEDWADRRGAGLDIDRYPEINDIIHNATVIMGEDICDALDEEGWKSYVSEVYNDGTIVISAGEESELKPDVVLETFDNTEIISGLKDQEFYKPGVMTGRIKVSDVLPDRIEGVIIEDMGIKVGDTVRQEP